MKFLFTCGGTAGHINPALAVAGQQRALYPPAAVGGLSGLPKLPPMRREFFLVPLHIFPLCAETTSESS